MTPLKCPVCGEDMHLATIEPHHPERMRGFEHRTFRCDACGDIERRFVFDPRASIDLAVIGIGAS